MIRLLALTCLIVTLCPVQTATAEEQPVRYLHHAWNTENGLPQNSVTTILQSRDGYLWVGTFGGLARFDGVKFTIFDTGNSPGLKSNRIITLYEDRAGVLWIGTEQGGLSRYFRGTFTTYTTKEGLPDNYIYSLAEDAEGGLWVATGNGLARLAGRRFTTYTTRDGLADNRIFLVKAGRDESLWLVSHNGLTRWQGGRFSARLLPGDNSFEEARSLFEGPDGSVWIAGTRFCARFRDETFTFYPRASSQTPASIFSSPGGTLRFLMRSEPPGFEGGRVITDPSLAGWAGARAIIEDREGNLWIGSGSDGLYRYKAAQVEAYAAREGLSDDEFLVIAGDGADGLWLGDHHLFHFRNGSFTKDPRFAGIPDSTTGYWAVLQDREGTVWAGSYGELHRFKDGRWSVYGRQDSNVLTGDPIAALYEDRAGNLWVGTGNAQEPGGLYRFKDGAFIPYRAAEGLTLTDVRLITEDREGALWLGGASGMSRLKDGVFTNYTTEQGLSNNYVRDIYEDADGTRWIGTYGGGLNRFKDGHFTPITTKDGLFDNIVSRILEDDHGNLWMSCNRGIYRASRKELNDLAEGRTRTVTCISYGVADGMLSNETNGGSQPAGWKDPEGKLWFPTIRGVVRIDPDNFNELPPLVVIEQTLVDKTPADSPQGPVEMRPGQSDLEIHYTGLSLVAPEKVRFRYKLEGYDRDWVDARERRVAYYTNIPPGTYSFRVMAANNDGIWSTQDATIRLVVVPPFWRTWWFVSICVFAAAGGAFLLYRRRVGRLERARAAQEAFSKQLIESQENERKRIAAELHDSLGQDLLIIKNRAALGLKLLGDADRTREQMERIAGTASQAITEVREIAYNLRPYHLDEIGLTQSLEELVERVANASPIRFASDIDNINDLCPKDSAINLYRIVQEGLNNVVKHSAASEAKLLVRRNTREIEVTIEDNGKGFVTASETTKRKAGFGLTGLSERARILGGTLTVESAPGRGTTVRFRLPVQDGHHDV
ncbi:MAG: two-component regulator propeller domain-containing protein [Pyrinomonadaceae bacterium]